MVYNEDVVFDVYLIHNLVNGKIYVGITKRGVYQRWLWHCSDARLKSKTYLCNAIRKYGPLSFSYEVLNKVKTKEEANNLERLWILVLRSYDGSVGYNLRLGGEGRGSYTKEERKQLSLNAKLAGHGRWNKGRKHLHVKHPWTSELNRNRKGKTHIELYGEEKAQLLAKRNSLKSTVRQRRVFLHICYSCFKPFRVQQRNQEQLFCSRACSKKILYQ